MTNQTENTNDTNITNELPKPDHSRFADIFGDGTPEWKQGEGADEGAGDYGKHVPASEQTQPAKEEILMQDDETGEWYPVEIEATDDNDDDEININDDLLELEWQVAEIEQQKYIAEMQAKQDAFVETEAQSYSQPSKNLMSVTEVAAMVNRAPATVRQTILRGALPAQKIGKQWIIFKSDALKFWQDKN